MDKAYKVPEKEPEDLGWFSKIMIGIFEWICKFLKETFIWLWP